MESRRAAAGIVAIGILAGCSVQPSPSPTDARGVSLRPLPALTAEAHSQPCAELPAAGIIEGDPRDPRVVWIQGGRSPRDELVWPPGFMARLGEPIEVIDPRGRVVARTGDPAPATCVTPNGPLFFAEFNS
jgi:hypothetical protein